METLNPEVQSIVNRCKNFSMETLSDNEREKLKLEKERILSLNEKLYKQTQRLSAALHKSVLLAHMHQIQAH